MISNQILQNTIEGLKGITRIDLCVMDIDGKVLASTFPENGDYENAVLSFVASPADSQVIQGYQFFKIFDEHQLEYILLANGGNDDVYMIGKIAAFQIQNLLVAYKERFDKDNFIKNLLLDNLLPMDIAGYAKQMHVDTGCRWTVFLVEGRGCEAADIQMILKNILANRTMDFVAPMEEHTVAVLRSMKEGEGREEMEELAHVFVDTVSAETLARIRTSCGTPAKTLREASRSYKEAKMALEVAEIFDSSRTVITYEQLGIGRLIYQLPVPLCEMFLREVFGDCDPEEMDEELLSTIYRFMDNNLNLSETSRQLYVHRNTLVYRLEKMQRTLGLDIRKFEDAMTFKIAMMVRDYMKYLEKRED